VDCTTSPHPQTPPSVPQVWTLLFRGPLLTLTVFQDNSKPCGDRPTLGGSSWAVSQFLADMVTWVFGASAVYRSAAHFTPLVYGTESGERGRMVAGWSCNLSVETMRRVGCYCVRRRDRSNIRGDIPPERFALPEIVVCECGESDRYMYQSAYFHIMIPCIHLASFGSSPFLRRSVVQYCQMSCTIVHQSLVVCTNSVRCFTCTCSLLQ